MEEMSDALRNQLLTLLPVIAKQIGAGNVIDQHFLDDLLNNYESGFKAWALEALQTWADTLLKISSRPGEEESIISELQDLGIPEAPAVLAVNMVINLSAVASINDYKPRIVDLYTTKAREEYRIWLPDHDWHYDLDWNTIPFWIKKDPHLVQQLSDGQDIVSRFIRYSIDEVGLKRKLHDYVPIFLPMKPREIYHEWLPDHEWHNDIDSEYLPQWLRNDARQLDHLIHGRDVMGKYVRYKFANNALWRKLHDSVPINLNIKPPGERYHYWLPDHNWHNDLDWQHLPVWIKGSTRYADPLRRGQLISGKTVIYKYENNRLLRRLKDGIPIRRR